MAKLELGTSTIALIGNVRVELSAGVHEVDADVYEAFTGEKPTRKRGDKNDDSIQAADSK